MNHAKLVSDCQARLAAIEERRRLRLAGSVPHGTLAQSSAPEAAPPQVQPPAVSDSTAAPSAGPPGPPDSPGDPAPGTPSQITGFDLPPIQRWRELRDNQGKWRDVRWKGYRFSILETEFEPRVMEYIAFVDGRDIGQYSKAREALTALQGVARGLVPL